MTTLQTLLLKILGAVLAALILTAFGAFLGYRYEASAFEKFVSAQAVAAQAAKDKAAAVAAQDKEVKDEIDKKDQAELAGYVGYVNELLLRNQSVLRAGPGSHAVPPTAAGARHADVAADGPAAGSADRALSCADPSTDADDPGDHVTLDALLQLKAWREYARGTGQVQ